VQSGDTHIEQAEYIVTHFRQANRRFFGYGKVGCPGCRNGDCSVSFWRVREPESDSARRVVEDCARESFRHGGMGLGRRAGDQEVLAGTDDPFGNCADLLGCFALSEHYFRKTLANAAVMIDTGEANVLERRVAQELKESGVRGLRC